LQRAQESVQEWDAETKEQNESAEKKICRPVREIIEHFDNVDRSWSDEWAFARTTDWHEYEDADRDFLSKFFRRHPDVRVREIGIQPLCQMQDSDALLELLSDPFYLVRKSAAYYVRQILPDPRIARRLWEMITVDNIASTHGTEAVESYVVHSTDNDTNDRLLSLALSDDRESIRMPAVRALCNKDSRDYACRLVPLLGSEPLVTWAVHRMLLEAFADLEIQAPNVKMLLDVDGFFLQQALAVYLA
jgi:hypothetical protein